MKINSSFEDLKLERKLLKSFLIKTEKALKNIDLSGLDHELFSGYYRQEIAKIIFDYKKKHGQPISVDLLQKTLKRKYKQNEIGYKESIESLAKIVDTKFQAKEFEGILDTLRQYSTLRKTTEAINYGIAYLYEINDGKVSIDQAKELIDNVKDKLEAAYKIDLNTNVREGDPFKHTNIISDLQQRRDYPEETKGIDTGFSVLTAVTNGWNPGELILVAGRPGHGKSILLMNFACNAYIKGYNVLIFSLEMPYRQQQLRIFSNVFNIPYLKLKMAQHMRDDEWELLQREVSRYKQTHQNMLFMIDAPETCTVEFVDRKIAEFENRFKTKVDLIVIDPLYLMRPSKSSDRRDKDDPVGMLSGELKVLAMKRAVPILSASQINREGGKRHQTGKDPSSMDLSFSDRLAHNSDSIFILTSDYNDLAQLHIVKFRDGAGPKLYLEKKFHEMKFVYSDHLNDAEEIKKYTHTEIAL